MKYEDIYPKGYNTLGELFVGLTQYFTFYNDERPHQGLNNLTPSAIYASGRSGEAMIVANYGVRDMAATPVAPATFVTFVTRATALEVSGDASGGPAGGEELRELMEKQGSAVLLRGESSIT